MERTLPVSLFLRAIVCGAHDFIVFNIPLQDGQARQGIKLESALSGFREILETLSSANCSTISK
ncbi:hypothetical protein E4K67_16700 [Desulfosporosinus fructosivorans]|uniref:Uncharacterized protein n=1 Tax=Desulfosporosinus fructosivorans TaxID=2018669 RepID=A0A4Z0R545_9FIRM|nr:hypothetical protein [Desulfosporosinus fructosivorans]TGE36756.1 hypothetical protein E4K67_16700 [Desulfosporosinus fructosivorans]